ncbi:uncharacterized protein LOC144575983 [Carex rostrata]
MRVLEILMERNHAEGEENSGAAHTSNPQARRPLEPFEEELDENEDPQAGKNKNKGDSNPQNQRCYIPRLDFSVFDGEDPVDWIEECDQYFELYQIPEVHKTRMATMSLTGDAKAWYKAVKISKKLPPWPIFIEEVLDFFAETKGNPIDEFKRIHQVGRVDDYAKNFLRAKSRLIGKGHIDASDEFYVGCFMSGLREDIRNTIDLFEPSTLKSAIRYARKIEVVLGGTKKLNGSVRSQQNQYPAQPYQNSKFGKNAEVGNKKWSDTNLNSTRNNVNSTKTMTMEEMKAKGLCFKCGDKYYMGHRCGNKTLHTMEVGDEEEEEEVEQTSEEPDTEITGMEGKGGEGSEEEEQATISLCTHGSCKNNGTLQFKGYIGQNPVCIFMDGGSTHSFINPTLIQMLNLKTVTMKPMSIGVANGAKMVSTLIYPNLKFTIQKVDFEANLVALDIPGFDIILGVDWLSQFGHITKDYLEGSVSFNNKGNSVFLKVEEVVAKVKICEQSINITKEKKKGSQVILAHLFSLEVQEQPREGQVEPSFQKILDEYSELFQEPVGLPPAREVDHKIPLKDESKVVNLRP